MAKGIEKKIDELNKKFDGMKKTMTKWEKDAKQKIKDNPMQSVAVAFGVGALAGAVIVALMGRRR